MNQTRTETLRKRNKLRSFCKVRNSIFGIFFLTLIAIYKWNRRFFNETIFLEKERENSIPAAVIENPHIEVKEAPPVEQFMEEKKSDESSGTDLKKSLTVLKSLLEQGQLELFQDKSKDAPLYFDIGLSDGADTAVRLSQGYSVVSVDAYTPWIEKAKEKFEAEINDNRLLLFNIGLSTTDEESMRLYFKEEGSVTSSFDPKKGCRRLLVDDPRCMFQEIAVVKCEALFTLINIPAAFVKIDIEMLHHTCVRALNNLPISLSPKTLCWEEHDIPFGSASIKRPITDIKLVLGLYELGYNQIKVVLQGIKAPNFYKLPVEMIGSGQHSGSLTPDEMMHYRSNERIRNGGKHDTKWRTVEEVLREGIFGLGLQEWHVIKHSYFDICMKLADDAEILRALNKEPENFPLSSYAN